MVSLKSIFKLSFLSKIFKPNWKRCTCFIGIGLCLTLITLSTIVAMQAETKKPNQIISDAELFNFEELEKMAEKQQGSDFTSLCNNTFNSFILTVPLYSKLNSTDILGNTTREKIYNIILTNSGITLGSITRKLQLKTGTVSHHLRILEREEYIKSRKTGKFRRYYVLGVKATGFNEIQDQIISKIKEYPGVSQSEIGRELQLSRQLINYHIKDLILSNIIKTERMGNKSNCFVID